MELARHGRPGRDVLARLIYGFRISVLFGLILAGISSVIGIAAGAVQGYFGGWIDLHFQRFIEIWSAIPSLYLLIILSTSSSPRFFIAARHPAAVLLGVAGRLWCAPSSCAPATSNMSAPPARWGCRTARSWSSTCCPTPWWRRMTFLPFILNGSITTLTSLDFLGFGLPPGSPSLGELLLQGKSNIAGALAGPDRLLRHRRHALAADLHRRGRARRLRPAEDVRVRTTVTPPLHPRSLRRLPPGRAGDAGRRPRVVRRRAGRDAWRSWASPGRASRSRRCRS